LCEQYDIYSDKWTPIEVFGISPIAAFAWCQVDENEIAILGGTDGELT
jgi:hypothetical protein